MYILQAIDYMSKWAKAILTRTNTARITVRFLRENIFSEYGMPRAIISEQDNHFDN